MGFLLTEKRSCARELAEYSGPRLVTSRPSFLKTTSKNIESERRPWKQVWTKFLEIALLEANGNRDSLLSFF
jgi:hypothetical protein